VVTPDRDDRVEDDDRVAGDRVRDVGGHALGDSDRGESDALGRGIVRLDVRATAVFAVVSVAAAVWPDPIEYLAVPVAVALFVVGTGAFLWAYGIAVARSRYDQVTMGGVFFLAGDVAPASTARTLRAALGVQIVVGVGVAAMRPFTALAAGVLAPMLGLGLMALWGARHGRFPAREEPAPPDAEAG
jgi:hypothetical protein